MIPILLTWSVEKERSEDTLNRAGLRDRVSPFLLFLAPAIRNTKGKGADPAAADPHCPGHGPFFSLAKREEKFLLQLSFA